MQQMNSRRRRSARTFFLILILLFIWGQSCLPIDSSAAESGRILALLRPLLTRFLDEKLVTDHLVRKLAHFTEFGALGFLGFRILRARRRPDRWGVIVCLMLMLCVALLDETIQIFSGRGDAISDVWLDFAGACTGFSFSALFCFLFSPQKR